MKLFDAILDANHRALAGDTQAGVHPDEFAAELPIAALTCIDARLNPFFPDVLGLPKEHFIWLRNAGNIITGPMSSTMRSLALACAVKGAKEIAIIGHTDCLVCKTSTAKLTDAFRALGVDRNQLPQNLTEFFGLFASERQNVIKAVDFVRQSPLVGSAIPVHGLIVEISTGKLDWVVNGYQTIEMMHTKPVPTARLADHSEDIGSIHAAQNIQAGKSIDAFRYADFKFPDTKIGEINAGIHPTPATPPPVPMVHPKTPPPSEHYPEPAKPHSVTMPRAPLPMPGHKLPLPPRIRGRT